MEIAQNLTDEQRLRYECLRITGDPQLAEAARQYILEGRTEILEVKPDPYTVEIDATIVSNRAKHVCMYQLNVHTVGELAEKTVHEVQRARNVGINTFLELDTLIKTHGLRWKVK